ncbi:hypothetical protein [Mesorhizobium sp.]|uniref:hypothetical protein n=1 Tax=Mesorhizobium sp. TaxID=1871066 RepID=UPI0025BD29CF|nr:hypothetical protein [Mesorhizobium sp.]
MLADPRGGDPGRVLQEYPDLLSPDLLSLVGLVGGSSLLTMVREEVRLGTVRWNPFSRTRL